MNQWTRREFLRRSGAAAATAAALPLSGPALAASRSRADGPNVLMIISDQLNAFTTGVAGCDVKTPTIDRLARQGAWMRNATCAYPLCVPSRIAMATGVYPHQRDYFGNNGGGRSEPVRREFAQTNRGYPLLWQYFRQAGYDGAYALKWHVPVDQKDPDQCGFTYIGGGSPTARTSDIAERIKAHDGSKPFFHTISYDIPHQICGWARKHRAGDHRTPPPPADNCPPLPANHRRTGQEPEALAIEQERGAKIAYPTADWDEEDWRQYIHAYRRYTEGLDEMMATLVQAVDESPAADNTIIVFVADHGDGCAAHGWNQKTALWEECIRVPWMIRAPGGRKGVVCDAPVSSGIDMIPTLLDLAGLDVPDKLIGQSLAPVIRGDQATLRDHTVTETAIARGMGRTLRTERYKYTVYTTGARGEQFFDLKEDPGELHNRIGDASLAKEIARHRDLLRAWDKQTNDTYFDVPDSA
jgi:arylsulfatase A-like enzyme